MLEGLSPTDPSAIPLGELLTRIPETWQDFDTEQLTEREADALSVLVAAGLVERHSHIRLQMRQHEVALEATITCTGEFGQVEALEGVVAAAWDTWQATYLKLKQETPEAIPSFRCEQLSTQAWRLTSQGVLARADWQEGHEQQVIRIALRQWPHTFRPPVRGRGRLIHLEHKSRSETSFTAVDVQNWGEGAEVISKAFEKLLEQQTSQLTPASNTQRKDGRTSDTEQRLQQFFADRAEQYEMLVTGVLKGDAAAITVFRREFGPASFARHFAAERNLKADKQEINRIRTAVQDTFT